MAERTCHFSQDRVYRYCLRIIWNPGRKPQMFIGLNPSTADEENDDPTVRRCIDFAKRWGAGGLVMANACAFRATDPRVMLRHVGDKIGPENTIKYLERLAAGCQGKPVAAWGRNLMKVGGQFAGVNRHFELLRHMGPLDCLQLNGDGTPAHPLYLPARLVPFAFNYKAADDV